MTTRTVTKVLAAQEDLLLGQGETTQTRQGELVTVKRMDLPWVFQTIAQVSALDTSKYNHCIYDNGTVQRLYRYDATSTETADDVNYIDPDTGVGQWVLVRPQDILVLDNGESLALDQAIARRFVQFATFEAWRTSSFQGDVCVIVRAIPAGPVINTLIKATGTTGEAQTSAANLFSAFAQGEAVNAAGFGYSLTNMTIEANAFGLNGNGITNDITALKLGLESESLLTIKVGTGTFSIDDSVDVQVDGKIIIGNGYQSRIQQETDLTHAIHVGDTAVGSAVQYKHIVIDSMTFQNQPGTASGGSDNNSHPLTFSYTLNGRALFNNFLSNELGLRFSRDNATDLNQGIANLGLGNFFLNSGNLVQEFMGVLACKNIGWTSYVESGEASANHANRFAGQSENCISLGGNVQGLHSTGASFQSGAGHILSAVTIDGATQGIQALGSVEHWMAGPFVSRNSVDYGVRIQDVGRGFVWGVVADCEELGVYCVNSSSDPSYMQFNVLADTTVAGVGADHHRFEGDYNTIDLTAIGMSGGLNGIHVTSGSNYCRGRLMSEQMTSADANERDLRVDGVGHIMDLHGHRIQISGSKHNLRVAQYTSAGNVVIGASESVIAITAGGGITISGSDNTINVITDATLTISGNNNIVTGKCDGNFAITGDNNDYHVKVGGSSSIGGSGNAAF